MGCGISRFDPKEVVEGTANNFNHNDPSNYSNHKSSYSTSNCFTGESKPLVHQGRPPPPDPCHSSLDRAAPRDQKMMKIKTDVKREEVRGINNNDSRMRMRTRTETPMHFVNDDDSSNDYYDENDQNCREICRGGSPSFREYCVDSDSRSGSMESEDDCEGDHCKLPPKHKTLNCEKEKGGDNEIGKKERRGKGIRNALHRGKTGGGVKNLLTSSSRPQQHNTDLSSHQLLAKPS